MFRDSWCWVDWALKHREYSSVRYRVCRDTVPYLNPQDIPIWSLKSMSSLCCIAKRNKSFLRSVVNQMTFNYIMWILQVDQVSSQIFLMMEKKQKRKVSEKNGILKKLRDKKMSVSFEDEESRWKSRDTNCLQKLEEEREKILPSKSPQTM